MTRTTLSLVSAAALTAALAGCGSSSSSTTSTPSGNAATGAKTTAAGTNTAGKPTAAEKAAKKAKIAAKTVDRATFTSCLEQGKVKVTKGAPKGAPAVIVAGATNVYGADGANATYGKYVEPVTIAFFAKPKDHKKAAAAAKTTYASQKHMLRPNVVILFGEKRSGKLVKFVKGCLVKSTGKKA